MPRQFVVRDPDPDRHGLGEDFNPSAIILDLGEYPDTVHEPLGGFARPVPRRDMTFFHAETILSMRERR